MENQQLARDHQLIKAIVSFQPGLYLFLWTLMDVDSEYSESSSITFEWTLRGLNSLFDSTKGDKKSKVTKSIRFGNNRWQVIDLSSSCMTET